jgi:hypothetical protein
MDDFLDGLGRWFVAVVVGVTVMILGGETAGIVTMLVCLALLFGLWGD